MEEKKQIRIGKIKIDRTLAELCIGLVFWGILCQITGIFFVKDKSGYSIGLWYGILTGMFAGIHMWWTLDRALGDTQAAIVKRMTRTSIIRYLIIVIAIGLIMIVGFGNPLSAFLGLIGLKLSAYIQPLTHKLISRLLKDNLKKNIE